jgi:hypothetical protein
MRIKYLIVFLLMCFIVQPLFAQQTSKGLRPPAFLKADYNIANPNVYLSWIVPGHATWLHYDSGNYETSMGTNKEGIFEVAIKFEPEDLLPYDSFGITKFAFVPAEETATYIFKIWIGESASNVVYEDTLTNLTINAWNTLELDSTVYINADSAYYYGYRVVSVGEGYPAGCDKQKTVYPGKSDLIRFSAETPFVSLYQKYGSNINLNIQVYAQPVDEINQPVTFAENVFFNNSNDLLTLKDAKEIKKFEYSETKETTPDFYIIYRNNVQIGTSGDSMYHDILTESGVFEYTVSAVYGQAESPKSNTVKVLYDNDRIPVNAVVSEVFINVNESSPNSWGAFKGIVELEDIKPEIAPVVYHSASAILGDDPFSNQASEDRFNYYFTNTLSFPMGIFNGDIFQGGGSTNTSLFDIYKTLYDSVLNRLTPIAQSVSLEKISNTIYRVNYNAQIVGVYPDTGLVVHAVLTRDKIDYSWYNDEFSNVRFVASGMFPDANGTPLTFNNGDASATIDVTIDPLADRTNYRIVVFIQNKTTFTVLNGNILKIPVLKNIEFTVVDNNDVPVENAEVTTNGETKKTNAEGKVSFGIYSDAGVLNYVVAKDDYTRVEGEFNIDTTQNVLVKLIYTDIDNKLSVDAKIYPNPAKDYVNIIANINSQITVYNSLGTIIYNGSMQSYNQTIDLSTYKKGVYFINIKSEKSDKTFKLIIAE